MGSYYAIKGHSAASQRGIILVESTQIRWFSRLSGRGRLVRRPRVSKLRLKGLSDAHSNETAVEAAIQGACVLNKRATLTTCLLKKRELKNSSKLDWKRAKCGPPDERTMDEEERIAYSNSRWRCRWEKMKTVMMMMMSENQLSRSQVHVTAFCGTEG